MTERTAAEILLAQCEVEVAEAKAQVWRELIESGLPVENQTIAAIEELCMKVTTRWWVSRMTRRTPQLDPEQAMARGLDRAKVLAACVTRIIERSGAIDPTSVQISLMGVSADINALWGCLIEAGIVTQQMRQDYLDESINQIFTRVEDQAQKIILAGAPSGRPS